MQEIIQFISNHNIIFIIWIVLFIVVTFDFFSNFFSKVKNITYYEAINLINKEDAIIFDLRNQEDYLKGHIVNSINLSLLDINNDKLKKIEKLKYKPIIIIYDNDIKFNNLVEILIQLGNKNIYVFKEGISVWNEKKLPLVQKK